MSGEARQGLKDDLQAFIARPGPDAFDGLAARVLAHQARAIPHYGQLMAARDALGADWREAPMVPSELFRDLDLCSGEAGGGTTFRTSGTTGDGRRGTRRVPDLDLYHAAMGPPFIAHVLHGDTTPRPWICLVPPVYALPDSSLSHMVSGLAARLADPGRCRWLMDRRGLDLSASVAALEQARREGEPVVIPTTAFALVQLLDHLDAEGVGPIPLPAGSRMMLTGGFKGRSRALSEADLIGATSAALGLRTRDVVAEYGMTELTSQAYGSPFEAPPWLKLRVVDPVTLADAPTGEVGLVACFDLLNLDNVSPIVTSDLGALDAQGRLSLHGRAQSAVARGCSLTAEELGARGA